MLIDVKMTTIDGFFTVISLIHFVLSLVEHEISLITSGQGPKIIKLEFILKLKIKRNDWLLVRADKQPIIALLFEFETIL